MNKYLTKLHIKNFQSHRDSTLEFGNGVNLIIGASGHGKSSIIRAIRLLIENKPGGNSFVSRGSQNCEISLEFEDKKITREKGENNLYKLEIKGQKPEEFKSFGMSVPDPIKNVLNLTPDNIQNQLDPPYMLTLNSGSVARKLNEIANISAIDSAQSYLKSRMRKADSKIKTEKEVKSEKEIKIKSFQYLDEMENILQEIEEQNNSLENKIEAEITLRTLLVQIQEKKELSEKISSILNKARPYLDNAKKIYQKWEGVREECDELKTILQKLSLTKSKWVRFGKISKTWEQIEKLETEQIQLKKIQEEKDRLESLFSKLQQTKNILSKKKELIKSLQNEYWEIMPRVCPICGSAILK